jgi:hypothetical protein
VCGSGLLDRRPDWEAAHPGQRVPAEDPATGQPGGVVTCSADRSSSGQSCTEDDAYQDSCLGRLLRYELPLPLTAPGEPRFALLSH